LFWIAEALLKFRTGTFAAVSKREADLARSLPGRQARVVMVPQALTDDRFQPLHLPERRSEASVVAVGRAQPQKGVEFFARAARHSAALRTNITWHWLGGGDERYVAVLQAAGVTVAGWASHEAVLESLSNASVYVHTASWEGMPLTIIEATSLGLPVIARDIGALHGTVAGLVQSPEEMVQAICELFATNEARVSTASQTWATIAGRFTSAQQAKALHRAYAVTDHT
jgi:glycosyltransferase involved in cell wall biosynthesis